MNIPLRIGQSFKPVVTVSTSSPQITHCKREQHNETNSLFTSSLTIYNEDYASFTTFIFYEIFLNFALYFWLLLLFFFTFLSVFVYYYYYYARRIRFGGVGSLIAKTFLKLLSNILYYFCDRKTKLVQKVIKNKREQKNTKRERLVL